MSQIALQARQHFRESPGGFVLNLGSRLRADAGRRIREKFSGYPDDEMLVAASNLAELGYDVRTDLLELLTDNRAGILGAAILEGAPGAEEELSGIIDEFLNDYKRVVKLFRKELNAPLHLSESMEPVDAAHASESPKPLPSQPWNKILKGLVQWVGTSSGVRFNPDGFLDTSHALSVRVLQLRLKRLGYFDGTITGVFGESTKTACARFRTVVHRIPDFKNISAISREDFELLCDPYALNRTVMQRLEGQPITVRCIGWSSLDFALKDWNATALKNGRFCDDAFGVPSREYGTWSPMNTLDDLTHSRPNREAIQLVQVWLHFLSLYDGCVDGTPGPGTLEALERFIAENEQDVERFIRRIEDNKVAIAPAVFEVFGTERPDATEVAKLEHYVLEQVEQELAEADRIGARNPEEPVGWVEWLYEKAVSGGTWIYGQARSVVVHIGKAIGRGAKWVWGLFRTIGNSGAHLIRWVFKKAEGAFRYFHSSLRNLLDFLDKGSVVTGNYKGKCFTLFEQDLDAVNLVLVNSPNSGVTAVHCKTIRDRMQLLSLACEIIATGISTVRRILTPPIGWLRLGVALTRAVLNAIRSNLHTAGRLVEESG